MSNERSIAMHDYVLISRVAHVIERSGLAMAGAMCGTFVAAQMAKTSVALSDSVGFIALMVLVGMIGFYLGIDIPRRPASVVAEPQKVDPVELLSANGTFLATVAALVSVAIIVLDEVPQRALEFVVGSCWTLGIVMQIGAGLIGRQRLNRKASA